MNEALEQPPLSETAQQMWTHNKAAIVGMGPAGLLSAYYLFMQGYHITIFEKRTEYSRDQRIVVSQNLCLALLIQSRLLAKGVAIREVPPALDNGISFLLDNTHLLQPDEHPDDAFFQHLIDENFVIEIKVVQIYLQKKLHALIDETKKSLNSDKPAKEKWRGLNPYIRINFLYQIALSFQEQDIEVDDITQALRHFLTYLNINYIKPLEQSLAEFEDNVIDNFFVHYFKYPFYELTTCALSHFVNAHHLDIQKGVTIDDVDQFVFHWTDSQQATHTEEFEAIILAEGFTREIFAMINDTLVEEEKIPTVKLPKHRHALHGAILCQVDFGKTPITQDRKLITSVIHNSSRMNRGHIEQLRTQQWSQDYCPVTYLQAVESKNIIYLTGEVPLAFQNLDKEKQTQAQLQWARTILNIEYGLAADSITGTTASYTFELGATALAKSYTPIPVGNSKRGLYIVGDCSMPACYLYGHGILEAYMDVTKLFQNLVCHDLSFLRERHENKIQMYRTLNSLFCKKIYFDENYPTVSRLLINWQVYHRDLIRYAKWTGLVALGAASIYSLWQSTDTQSKSELAWKFVKGFSTSLIAGTVVSGFFYRQEQKNESKKVQQPGTIVAFK